MKKITAGFTIKQVRQKINLIFSFASARWEQTQSPGFTLIETLVAVSILAISVAGPLVTASRAYNAVLISDQQLTATYLAQEGLEYIRTMRDNAYLSQFSACQGAPLGTPCEVSNAAWNNFTTASGGSASLNNCIYNNFAGVGSGTLVCTLDPILPSGVGAGLALQPCSIGPTGFIGSYPQSLSACANLALADNGTTKVYTQSAGELTPYRRIVQIGTAGTGFVQVIVAVSWTYKGITYSVQQMEYLAGWQ